VVDRDTRPPSLAVKHHNRTDRSHSGTVTVKSFATVAQFGGNSAIRSLWWYNFRSLSLSLYSRVD
jgi:hypothetical protein